MGFLYIKEPPLEEAAVAILPVPYGGTTSYGTGTGRGPDAILEASAHMELFDEELLFEPHRVGLHTMPEVPPHMAGPHAMIRAVHQRVTPLVAAGKMVVGLGGEHSQTLGLVEPLVEAETELFSVLQLDAHADLRHTYHETRHSHACIMRRLHDDLNLPLVQVGLRSLCREEWSFIQQQGMQDNIFWARDLLDTYRRGDDTWMDRIVDALLPRVYLTVDLDVLDPALLPATGTPEPGGLSYRMVVDLLACVAAKRHIIGCDIMELAPLPGQPASDYTAARLLLRMIGLFRPPPPHKK